MQAMEAKAEKGSWGWVPESHGCRAEGLVCGEHGQVTEVFRVRVWGPAPPGRDIRQQVPEGTGGQQWGGHLGVRAGARGGGLEVAALGRQRERPTGPGGEAGIGAGPRSPAWDAFPTLDFELL